MFPERRFYKASEQTSTIVANRSRPNEDLYLVYTGRNQDTGKPIIKAHVNPLVMWIWIGVHVVLIGTIIALFPNMKPAKITVKEKERESLGRSRTRRSSGRRGRLKAVDRWLVDRGSVGSWISHMNDSVTVILSGGKVCGLT